MANFDSPCGSKTSERILIKTKIYITTSRARQHMQIHVALRQSGWSRRTRDVTCCGFFVDLFYFFIFGIALSHRPQTDFDDLNVLWRVSAQGGAFWVSCCCHSPFRGSNLQNRNFWAWIGFFVPNAQNIETCILSKLLQRFQPNFSQH